MSDYQNRLLRHAVEQADKDYHDTHKHCEDRIATLTAQVAVLTAERQELVETCLALTAERDEAQAERDQLRADLAAMERAVMENTDV